MTRAWVCSVSPSLVITIVYATVPPGTVVARSADLAMVRLGSSTVTAAVQSGFGLPTGQVLPGAAATTVVLSCRLPKPWLLIVAE